MTRFFSRSNRRSTGRAVHPHFGNIERLEPRIAMDGEGIVETNISSSYEYGRAIELQANGRVVAAGFANFVTKGNHSANDGVLVRYNSDGSLDSALSGDGIQRADLGSTGGGFLDLTIQGDQKLVAGGHANVNNGQMAVVRYLPDGSLDTSFDGDGKAFTAFPGGGKRNTHLAAQGFAVELQTDEKVVIAGRVWNYATATWRFGLARFNSNGSLDTTFGGTGQITTDFGLGIHHEVSDLAVQSDGKIIAAGGGGGYFVLARYNPNGTLDTSFDGDGKVVHNVSSSSGWGLIGEIALQPDGKIVAGGGHVFTNQGLVARYNPDGSLDPSFGNGGLAQHPHFTAAIGGLGLQSDGRIVVSGLHDWRAGRLNSDGSVDTSFGGMGSVLISSLADGSTQVIQSNDPNSADDDKIILIGSGDGGNSYIVARLNNDGTFDSTWGGAAASASGTPLSAQEPDSLDSATSRVVNRPTLYAAAVDVLLSRESEGAAIKPRRTRVLV
jgi:uncharacterized delta-60 repeat protein